MTIDYDTLERMHKQEGWTDDQCRHFEAGWEAGQRAFKARVLDCQTMDDIVELDTDVVPERQPPVDSGYRPLTVEQAIGYLRAHLPQDDLYGVRILTTPEIHNSLGRMIRNDFGLWTDNTTLRFSAERFYTGPRVQEGDPVIEQGAGVTHLADGLLHPDVVSSIILDQLRKALTS